MSKDKLQRYQQVEQAERIVYVQTHGWNFTPIKKQLVLQCMLVREGCFTIAAKDQGMLNLYAVFVNNTN